MGNITVTWVNDEKNIILITLNNQQWTVDDMLEALHEANNMVREITHPYVTIADNRKSENYIPSNMIANFPRIARVIRREDNDKGTIVIVKSGISRTTTDIFSQVIKRITFVETMEQALEDAHRRLAK